MSEISDEKLCGTQSDSEPEIYCRDFLRGACDRKFCKFKHDSKQTSPDDDTTLKFCHDFQNTTCPRPHCKFIHCSLADEDRYRQAGELSMQVQVEVAKKYRFRDIQPVCNMFQEGVCRRTNCKYRHITQAEHEAEILRMLQMSKDRDLKFSKNGCIEHDLPSPRNIRFESPNGIGCVNLGRRNGVNMEEYKEFGPSEAKRRFFMNGTDFIQDKKCFDMVQTSDRTFINGYITAGESPIYTRIDARMIMLEEENSLLHKEIAQLKKQVSDLTATNEFLLDQNATLRITTKHATASNIASVTVPAVTITSTVPQQNNSAAAQPQTQVIHRTSVATVPVSLATVSTGNAVSISGVPAVSIAQPNAQQMLAQSQQILVSANASPQLALATSSQAQLAIAQQNLANLAQQTQPSMHPTSQAQAQQLATQQLTSQAPPHIALSNAATQQLGLATAAANQQLLAAQAQAQAQNLATSQQMEIHRTAINTSQAIAMSNASQPMVSYPIMTQSVLQNAMPH